MKICTLSSELNRKNIDLNVAVWEITHFRILTKNYTLHPLNSKIKNDIKSNFILSTLKEDPVILKYRNFYWKYLHVDPTKVRPSSEALIRRILHDKKLPKISPMVDAYNWASILSLIPMGAYDLDQIELPIHIRFTKPGEKFHPIGDKKRSLSEITLVTADEQNQIICQYPYRDANLSKISEQSRHILVIAYGCPGIQKQDLLYALERTKSHLKWLVAHNFIEFRGKKFEYYANYPS